MRIVQFLPLVFLLSCLPAISADSIRAEDVVAKHLDSLASAQARAALKTRVVQGQAHFQMLVGAGGKLDGTSGLVSEGNKLLLLIRFPNQPYRGEQFVVNDGETRIAATSEDHTRTAFGEFVRTYDSILKEGMLGGVLTTAWPLLHLDERKGRVSYEGRKKFDGRQLIDLSYHPKKSTDLHVDFLFDPETYRHVATIYEYSHASNLTADIAGSVNQRETRYRLEERFDDFKNFDGFNLPVRYELQFTRELQNSDTKVWDWQLQFDQVSTNITLDPRNFLVK